MDIHLCNDCDCERNGCCVPEGLVFGSNNVVIKCDNHETGNTLKGFDYE
jgi:hypothetical protein